MKVFQLSDEKDRERVNRFLSAIGVTIQVDLFGDCVAYIDEYRFRIATTRKAGRPSVITEQLIQSIYQYRYEGMTIDEIARKTGVSKGIIGKILKRPQKPDKVPEGQIQMDIHPSKN